MSTFILLQAIYAWLFEDRTALRYLHIKGGKETWRNVKIQSRTRTKQAKTWSNLFFFKGVVKLNLVVHGRQATSKLVHVCVHFVYFTVWLIQILESELSFL